MVALESFEEIKGSEHSKKDDMFPILPEEVGLEFNGCSYLRHIRHSVSINR